MRYADLERWLAEIGEKPSRATQVFNWMYRPGKLVADVRDMADVSAAFREKLASLATVDGDLEMRDVRTSADGTKKVTYALANGGGVVESVIIPSNVPGGRTTVCVSPVNESSWIERVAASGMKQMPKCEVFQPLLERR